MRAVVIETFGDYESGVVRDVPRPVPGPDQILVEVRAAPVNYVDIVVAAGKYQFAPPLPYTPGKGPAGIVAGFGDNVDGFALGDRVLAMAETGGYAQFACAPKSDCFHIPDTLSFAQAGAMSLAYDTAWFALRDRARIVAGDTVLVLGATGAVGRATMQLARAMGGVAIAGTSSPERFDSARAAGARHVVDLSTPNLRDSLRDQVAAVTDGRGVDIVIDMLGGDFFDAAIRAVAWRGRVVIVGFAAGRIPTLKVNYLMLKNIEVSGLQVSDYRKRRPDMMAHCFRELFEFHSAGKIDLGPVVETPLEDFASAMRAIEQRSASTRIVLTP